MRKLSLFLLCCFLLQINADVVKQTKKHKTHTKRSHHKHHKAVSRKLDSTESSSNTEEDEKSSENGSEEDNEVNEGEQEDEGQCLNDMLYSFGILNTGLQTEKSILCQDADNQSCCSRTSEKMILNNWKNNNKVRIKQYIESYIWLMKSILNYYGNFMEMAKVINSFPGANTTCRKAAENLIGGFIPKAKITAFIIKLEKAY